jgi:hypothetical protein
MDPVSWIVSAFVRIAVFFGEMVGMGICALWTGLLRSRNSGNFTRSKKPTKAQRAEQEESRRLAGCEEIVVTYAQAVGFIAREAIKREELAQMIDNGCQPDELKREIDRRIAQVPGIILGMYPQSDPANPLEFKLPFSLRDRHCYIIGRSGSGKTNLIRNMLLQDFHSGSGVGVLAPEQELITEEILPYIPQDRIDDVIYVNPADTEYPVPFNPLHLDEGEDIDQKVDDIFTSFKRLVGETGPRMDEILRQSLYALLERKGSTLLDLERLLSREEASLRAEIIRTSQDEQTIRFFRDTYPAYPKDAHLPITARINRLVRPKVLRTLLCQPSQSLNFRRAMDEGKILLFNLSDGILGEQTSQLLGQLIVSKIQLAVMSRADTPAAARRPFYLYLNEFQTFTGVNESSYEVILSRARKYQLGLVLANQQTHQLSSDLLHAILGNVATLITFNVSHDDAVRLSREYVIAEGGVEYIPPEDFLQLKTGEAIAKIGRNVFPLRTYLADKKPDSIRAKEVIERSRINYGMNVKPVVKEVVVEQATAIKPGEEAIDPSRIF